MIEKPVLEDFEPDTQAAIKRVAELMEITVEQYLEMKRDEFLISAGEINSH